MDPVFVSNHPVMLVLWGILSSQHHLCIYQKHLLLMQLLNRIIIQLISWSFHILCSLRCCCCLNAMCAWLSVENWLIWVTLLVPSSPIFLLSLARPFQGLWGQKSCHLRLFMLGILNSKHIFLHRSCDLSCNWRMMEVSFQELHLIGHFNKKRPILNLFFLFLLQTVPIQWEKNLWININFFSLKNRSSLSFIFMLIVRFAVD